MTLNRFDPSIRSLLTPGAADIPALSFDWADPLAVNTGFSLLAYIHAELSEAERQRLVTSLGALGYSLVDTATGGATGTYAFCAISDDQLAAVIAFRGTQLSDIRGVVADLLVLPTNWNNNGAMVHAGFEIAYAGIRDDVDRWMSTLNAIKVTFVGHSMGAALATLAGTLYPKTSVMTIGGPRVGNEAFISLIPGQQLTRVVNCTDAVANLPPEGLFGYTHPSQRTYLDSTGKRHFNPGDGFIANDQQAGRALYVSKYALKLGVLPCRELADHSPINYLNAFRRHL